MRDKIERLRAKIQQQEEEHQIIINHTAFVVVVLGDYGIAEDIKEEHFDAKNMKKFIDYDMLNMFIGAYVDEDKAHECSPAEFNYGLVYKTLKKAVGQAHMVIDHFFK